MDDENRLSRSVIHQDSSHKQDVTVSVTVHHGSVVKQTDVIVSITVRALLETSCFSGSVPKNGLLTRVISHPNRATEL